MSHYLVRQVEGTPNIDVRLETEVVGGGAGSDGWLDRLVLRSRADGATETMAAEELFVMIGAHPNTDWLPAELARGEAGSSSPEPMSRTTGAWQLAERSPLSLETSMPGVFAAGDIRHGSMNRVASAVGRGLDRSPARPRALRGRSARSARPGATLTPGWRLPGWLRRLTDLGTLPSDSEEVRLRKSVLTLSAILMATLSLVWVGTYAVLGLWLSAAIPFAYQLASTASIYTFARTRRYRLFRASQLWMSLLLPFALQWSLGGFANSSAVSLWAFTCPVGALLFVGARQAVPWFVAFGALMAVSGAIDPTLAANAPYVPGGVVVTFFVLNILGVTTTAYVLLQYFVRARERALAELEVERAKSERLLLNVLPASVASRLKESDQVIADGFPVGDRAVRGHRRLHPSRAGARTGGRGRHARPDVRRVGTCSPRATAWRRSRRSGTPTWWPAAFPLRARTTPRRSPTWRSRWARRSSAAQRRAACRSRCGSAWTPGPWSPA